jgi:hypothetical protein
VRREIGVEGNRRAWRNGRVCSSPTRNPYRYDLFAACSPLYAPPRQEEHEQPPPSAAAPAAPAIAKPKPKPVIKKVAAITVRKPVVVKRLGSSSSSAPAAATPPQEALARVAQVSFYLCYFLVFVELIQIWYDWEPTFYFGMLLLLHLLI